MNKIKAIFFTIIIVGFFIITMYSSLYLHEYYHKFEARNIEKSNEELCVSIIMNCIDEGIRKFGYYTFYPKTKEEYEKGIKLTDGWEERAYFFQAIYIILVNLIILLFILKIVKYKNE